MVLISYCTPSFTMAPAAGSGSCSCGWLSFCSAAAQVMRRKGTPICNKAVRRARNSALLWSWYGAFSASPREDQTFPSLFISAANSNLEAPGLTQDLSFKKRAKALRAFGTTRPACATLLTGPDLFLCDFSGTLVFFQSLLVGTPLSQRAMDEGPWTVDLEPLARESAWAIGRQKKEISGCQKPMQEFHWSHQCSSLILHNQSSYSYTARLTAMHPTSLQMAVEGRSGWQKILQLLHRPGAQSWKQLDIWHWGPDWAGTFQCLHFTLASVNSRTAHSQGSELVIEGSSWGSLAALSTSLPTKHRISKQAQYFRYIDQKNCKTHWHKAISSALNYPYLKEV